MKKLDGLSEEICETEYLQARAIEKPFEHLENAVPIGETTVETDTMIETVIEAEISIEKGIETDRYNYNMSESEYKIFYIDKNQCWYHKGIQDITNNIDDTVLHLNNIIKNGNYEKVIFMGTSAGGYASILFASLSDNVNNVISFIPQTILDNPIDLKYLNLKDIINKNIKYIIWGDTSIQDKNNSHHFLHCENIDCFSNVKIIKTNGVDIKQLRDNCSIKK